MRHRELRGEIGDFLADLCQLRRVVLSVDGAIEERRDDFHVVFLQATCRQILAGPAILATIV